MRVYIPRQLNFRIPIIALKPLLAMAFLLISPNIVAYRLSGNIKDSDGNTIPYVSVYINKTTYGVSSNIKGDYFIELDNGNYEIVFSMIGYEKKIVPITIFQKNEILNITLLPSVSQLNEVTITTEKEDPAYAIIRKALGAKSNFRELSDNYTCNAYIKSSLEKEYIKKIKKDSLQEEEEKKLTKERMNFIESFATVYFSAPNSLKEIKEAYKDLADKSTHNNFTISFYDDKDKPKQAAVNLNLFKTSIADAEFNFYDNLIANPTLLSSPLVSPLNNATFLSYRFKLEEYFWEDNVWVNKIKVTPRRTDAALFSGHIYIVDSIWCIKAVDLEIDKSVLTHFNYFRLFQKYSQLNNNKWALTKEEFFYNTKEGKATMIGSTYIQYSNYNLNPVFKKNFFNNELSVITDNAYDKDTSYWNSKRPITLKEEEQKFIATTDSIDTYYKSPKYLAMQDSLTNKIYWYEFLGGVSFENSFKKQDWYIDGMINNTLFGIFGVGGYRQRLAGNYTKEFKKGYKLTIGTALHYGFTNNDLKGDASVSYTYLPKKFGRIHTKYSNDYGFVNGYESFANILSMSNIVNNVGYDIGNEIEIFNGAYLDVTAEYTEVNTITNLKYSSWSNDAFGSNNQGAAFPDFTKFALEFTLKYTPAQKFYTEPYKKIVIGSKYPTFAVAYKKGIPNILKSISNYEFIELRVWDTWKFGSFGESKWKVYTGKFLNSKSLLFTENKFFRRSDNYFFSDPLRSFQLLDTSLNTTNEYFQVHYLHRFNGKILNKIPLLKKLKLMEVAGAGFLAINKNNFQHAEVYGGIEKPININKWKLRFKIGTYYVVSKSAHADVSGMLKFGIDIFDSFRGAWGY
ncbi:MAG: carboxypeptidase-like regulatory domain-containing protein [Bacteroidetes bacterium]|nr:carboxypeptidase-like regulatory domain-containing protein [Bacteroidota bacterium]